MALPSNRVTDSWIGWVDVVFFPEKKHCLRNHQQHGPTNSCFFQKPGFSMRVAKKKGFLK
jgi:hypothetical protein